MKFKRKPEWWVWVIVFLQVALSAFLIFLSYTSANDKLLKVNDPVYSIFKKERCTKCHALKEDLGGPSFTAISIRYKDADTAKIRTLSKTIMYGGVGNWGNVPMPPSSVHDQQAELIVRWILRLPHEDL